MRLYISGPMTGYDNWNYPAFKETAEKLKRLGHVVYDPTTNFNGDTGMKREEYFRLDFQHVLLSEGVVILPGWSDSWGAKAECIMAVELNLPFYLLNCFNELVRVPTYMIRNVLR